MSDDSRTGSEWFADDSATEFWTSERCYIQELLNTDEVVDVSLAVARVEPGVQTQLHALSGIEEIYVVRAGNGVIEVDGIERRVTVGDHVVVPASASQRVHNTGNADLVCYCLCRPRFTPTCYRNLESRAT